MNKSEKFWDKQAGKYDYSERRFQPVFDRILRITKNYLSISDIVLDYGCATGTKTLELAKHVNQIHGIDISSKMIEDAARKATETNIINTGFSQGTIFDNDFKNSSFDKITAYGILHLIKEENDVIKKIWDLLKAGGLFILSTACLNDKMETKSRIEFSLYRLIKILKIFPLHLNMYKPIDVEKLIISNGFEIIESESIFHGITISFIIAKKIV